MKLTYAAVTRLPAPDPSGQQKIHWDDELKGFGVLCSGVTDTRSFIVQRALPGGNGRKRRITICTIAEAQQAGKKIEDVRKEAADLIHDLRRGKDPKARGYEASTLQEALDDYIKMRPNLTETSRTNYEATVKGAFQSWLNRPLRDLSPDMIETRFHAIKAEVAARNGNRPRPSLFVSEPGAAAADGALRVLRLIWNFAADRAPSLPAWPAQRLRGQWYHVGRRERSVRFEDLKKFFAAVNEKDAKGEYTLGRGMRDLMLLLLFTGFRESEACSLRWENIDFDAGVIRLPAKATKTKRALDLPMSDLVRDLLVARQQLGRDPNGYVFPSRSASGHVEETKGATNRLKDRCGFPVNAHALRATFISITNNTRGVTPLAARALVNHAINVGDVHEGYVQEVELRKAAQAVARSLKERCGIGVPVGKNVRPLRAKRRRA